MALYLKVFALVMKTASKPLAKKVKEFVIRHPVLREWCISAAQRVNRFYHWSMVEESVVTKIGHGRFGRENRTPPFKPLSEDAALQSAADFSGELVVFAVAGGASERKGCA